ncbi:MAG: PilZ domain-containing protein [Desulfobacterales bacterium]
MEEENAEKRSRTRFEHRGPVRLEGFAIETSPEARMGNFSEKGIYFESDFYLVPGSRVLIGLPASPLAEGELVYECYRAVIRWRRFLEDSVFDYGYGVELEEKIARNGAEPPSRRGETRAHPRRPCSIPTLIRSGRGNVRGTIANASPGGVLIRCAAPLEQGTRVLLSIPLRQKKKIVSRAGTVVWTEQDRVGIRFDGPP